MHFKMFDVKYKNTVLWACSEKKLGCSALIPHWDLTCSGLQFPVMPWISSFEYSVIKSKPLLLLEVKAIKFTYYLHCWCSTEMGFTVL